MDAKQPNTEQQDAVIYEVKDRVAWVYFNRPEKRNAMNPALNHRMKKVLDELEFRDDVGVLVLGGKGSSWSAGMDLKEYFKEIAAQGHGAIRHAQRDAFEWWRSLRNYEKPTIAMVNGYCFGGAYAPLFACDLAFCADEAQFGLSEINWGILPGGGATKVATTLLGFRDAMYHAMMGENMHGPAAARAGLVNESVPLQDLKARVTAVAQVLLKKDPVALRATKDAVRRVLDMTHDDAERFLVTAQESADFHNGGAGRKEGMEMFLGKAYKPGLEACPRPPKAREPG